MMGEKKSYICCKQNNHMLQKRISEEKQGPGKREKQIRQGGRRVSKITEGTAVETKSLESLLLAFLLQMLWMCTVAAGAVVSRWWWSPLIPLGEQRRATRIT